ncbi:MAG: hypothetical protein IPK76_04855 [Lewinellaceae bacterium]|nr:hypothetical protein [Lewinellaceae bacterium]
MAIRFERGKDEGGEKFISRHFAPFWAILGQQTNCGGVPGHVILKSGTKYDRSKFVGSGLNKLLSSAKAECRALICSLNFCSNENFFTPTVPTVAFVDRAP